MERRVSMRNVKYVNFSYDLLYEILLRVPAEDLVRFKTVCKQWRSIISDPNFARAHLTHAEPEFLFSAEENYKSNCYKINVRENKGAQKLHLPVKVGIQLFRTFWLRSFCDGLLLLHRVGNPDSLTICNPVTRRLKQLPVQINLFTDWGLVYDTSIGKYKVFGINPLFQTSIGVLTQGGSTSSYWRYIRRTPRKGRKLRGWTGPICVGHKLHWTEDFMTDDGDHGFKAASYICSIDIAKEKLTEVEVGIIRADRHILAEVGGSLCVVNICPGYFETWVLTDDANNLWTRSFCFSSQIVCSNAPNELKIIDRWDPFQQKLFLSGDASKNLSESLYVLTRHENCVYFYNGKNNKWRKIRRLGWGDSLGYRSGFHVNSVVNWD